MTAQAVHEIPRHAGDFLLLEVEHKREVYAVDNSREEEFAAVRVTIERYRGIACEERDSRGLVIPGVN